MGEFLTHEEKISMFFFTLQLFSAEAKRKNSLKSVKIFFCFQLIEVIYFLCGKITGKSVDQFRKLFFDGFKQFKYLDNCLVKAFNLSKPFNEKNILFIPFETRFFILWKNRILSFRVFLKFFKWLWIFLNIRLWWNIQMEF